MEKCLAEKAMLRFKSWVEKFQNWHSMRETWHGLRQKNWRERRLELFWEPKATHWRKSVLDTNVQCQKSKHTTQQFETWIVAQCACFFHVGRDFREHSCAESGFARIFLICLREKQLALTKRILKNKKCHTSALGCPTQFWNWSVAMMACCRRGRFFFKWNDNWPVCRTTTPASFEPSPKTTFCVWLLCAASLIWARNQSKLVSSQSTSKTKMMIAQKFAKS